MDNRSDYKFLRFLFILIILITLVLSFFLLYFFRETNLLKKTNSELRNKERRSEIELQHLKKSLERFEFMVNQADTIFVDRKLNDTTSDIFFKDYSSELLEKDKIIKQKEEQFLLSVRKTNKILSDLSREKGNVALYEKKFDKALFHYLKSIDYNDSIPTRIAIMELSRNLSNENNKITGHEDKINCIAVNKDNKILASASFDGVIMLWDIENRKLIKSLRTDNYSINTMVFLDNKNLAFAGDNKLIRVVNIDQELYHKTFKGHTGNIMSIAFLPSKKVIISCSIDKSIKVWDYEKQELLQNLTTHTERVNTLAVSHDEKYLASGGKDNNIFIYDTNNFAVVKNFKVHESGVNTLSFSQNDKYILSGTGNYFGGEDFVLKTIEIANEKVLNTYNEHSDYVTSSSFFNTNEQLFISGSNDGTIKIWNIENSDSFLTLKGHTDYINNVIITGDNKYIISCSTDKSLRIWKTGINENINSIKESLKSYNYNF